MKRKEPKKPRKKKKSEVVYSQTPMPPAMTGPSPVYYNGKLIEYEVRYLEESKHSASIC